MTETAAIERNVNSNIKESLLRRKYVIPFLLACAILAFNQATGVNSVIEYNATILIQGGLSDTHAHLGTVIFTLINFVATIAAVLLVDRKGRKFLLSLGTAGIIISMICAGLLFLQTEKQAVDVKDAFQRQVTANQSLQFDFNGKSAGNLLTANPMGAQAATLVVIYSYGDFHGATTAVRSDETIAKPIEITRDGCLPANQVISFFTNPFADLDAARTAPLKIDHALITPVPGESNGWLIACTLFVFISFFAIGPGVCVWLALSELMPTRIRSNGMSIALLINQTVSTTIAAIFLPTVGAHGYSTMFFAFAGCSVAYFLTAFFLLPETKGKTLEEIEEYFGSRNKELA